MEINGLSKWLQYHLTMEVLRTSPAVFPCGAIFVFDHCQTTAECRYLLTKVYTHTFCGYFPLTEVMRAPIHNILDESHCGLLSPPCSEVWASFYFAKQIAYTGPHTQAAAATAAAVASPILHFLSTCEMPFPILVAQLYYCNTIFPLHSFEPWQRATNNKIKHEMNFPNSHNIKSTQKKMGDFKYLTGILSLSFNPLLPLQMFTLSDSSHIIYWSRKPRLKVQWNFNLAEYKNSGELQFYGLAPLTKLRK